MDYFLHYLFSDYLLKLLSRLMGCLNDCHSCIGPELQTMRPTDRFILDAARVPKHPLFKNSVVEHW